MGLSLCLSLPVLEELTSEILLRVPVRSFLRFRCVWNALVSSYPQFFAPQPPIQTCDWSLPYTASPAKSYLTLCNQCSKTHLSPKHISLLHNEGRFHVLGSCNGLMCLYGIYSLDVTLCNPSIRCQIDQFQTISN